MMVPTAGSLHAQSEACFSGRLHAQLHASLTRTAALNPHPPRPTLGWVHNQPNSSRGRCSRTHGGMVVMAAVVAEKEVQARTPSLPFVKLAGQEEMKLAILLNVVDPNIGGVLIMGDRGTGKSVAVSLAFLWALLCWGGAEGAAFCSRRSATSRCCAAEAHQPSEQWARPNRCLQGLSAASQPSWPRAVIGGLSSARAAHLLKQSACYGNTLIVACARHA